MTKTVQFSDKAEIQVGNDTMESSENIRLLVSIFDSLDRRITNYVREQSVSDKI